MAHNTYSHVSTIRRVELVRSHFEWNGQIEKKGKNEYTASVRITATEGVSNQRTAFAYFNIVRRDDDTGNFEASASYYISIRLNEADDERHESLFKDIVAKVVWSRFYDLVKTFLAHGNVEGPDIPIVPDSVTSVIRRRAMANG